MKIRGGSIMSEFNYATIIANDDIEVTIESIETLLNIGKKFSFVYEAEGFLVLTKYTAELTEVDIEKIRLAMYSAPHEITLENSEIIQVVNNPKEVL